ncbi:MAG: nucleoside-diphosphate kinase [Verrucomicrobia bacterium]|nr:nucleoside-diphosphate kinase [Verrucomicrobiota bacterium]
MAKELGFVMITPHSLRKSRTGGIIGRFSRIEGLEFVATRMFGPSQELVTRYADMLRTNPDITPDKRDILADYVLRAFGPETDTGRPHRVMVLLFEGEDAIKKIYAAAGGFDDTQESADTVRGTYGDCVHGPDGKVIYFEPSVLVAPTARSAQHSLKLWMEYAECDGGVVKNALSLPDSDAEKTLVIIKPDNFRFPSSRPGNIIDLFSRSGLRIIGAQVHRMSMAEAKEFYGPVQAVLREKLCGRTTEKACAALEESFGFPMPAEVKEALSKTLGPYYGDHQFFEIMQFMTGLWMPDVPESEMDAEGKVRCLVLIYAGLNAVNKIRTILGPTDPSKAQPGSVRKEYGSDIMVNAAHASDAPESCKREMGIIKPERNLLKKWFDKYYA